MLNCLNYLEGQEGQIPNIRTMFATILTVPRHLIAQPTSTVYSCKVRSGISVWPRGAVTRAKGCTSPILADRNLGPHHLIEGWPRNLLIGSRPTVLLDGGAGGQHVRRSPSIVAVFPRVAAMPRVASHGPRPTLQHRPWLFFHWPSILQAGNLPCLSKP